MRSGELCCEANFCPCQVCDDAILTLIFKPILYFFSENKFGRFYGVSQLFLSVSSMEVVEDLMIKAFLINSALTLHERWGKTFNKVASNYHQPSSARRLCRRCIHSFLCCQKCNRINNCVTFKYLSHVGDILLWIYRIPTT